MNYKIAVIGLGYVGLPVAVCAAKHFNNVVGFDINKHRVAELKKGRDHTLEVEPSVLTSVEVNYSCDPADLKECNFFIVTVPTPIDANRQPDLTPLEKASKTIGPYLSKGDIVVYESTVYPGVTEEYCGPILEACSGLKAGVDFKLGYSPERINPGDKERTLEKILKIVSAQDEESLQHVSHVYGKIVTAGLHCAPSIKVAEAAKVIENTQRDVNIALMNELALIFDKMDISTKDVLEAAGTKWNFLRFSPGLVGGHCIGVDPYYLTSKAESLGYHPNVILSGRRINDQMGVFIAQKMIKLLIQKGVMVSNARIGILGLTFKENVPDLRNSRVPDIISELRAFGVEPLVHDPMADADEAMEEYNVKLSSFDDFKEVDGIIMAVPHEVYQDQSKFKLMPCFTKNRGGVFIDVKSFISPKAFDDRVIYWSL